MVKILIPIEDDVIENDDSESEEDGPVTFEDLGLDERALAAVRRKGFEFPSPIQVLAIPRLLNGDSNVIARARTGTGKTAEKIIEVAKENAKLNHVACTFELGTADMIKNKKYQRK